MKQHLPLMYRRRFETEHLARQEVWRVLIDGWFAKYLVGVESVLDLGCGWGHFINQIDVPRRLAIDANSDARERLAAPVKLVGSDASSPWALPDASLDVVFTSNFLEHLPSRDAICDTLGEAARCLRPGGRLICLGPNIRYAPGAYWDFFDHLVPLSDRSVIEAIQLHDFTIEQVIPRFLPWSMAGRTAPPELAIRAYLKMPVAWKLLGRQFLVVATRDV